MVAVERMGIKEVPLEETKVLIESYLKKRFKEEQQVYPSDVADALGLKYETVRQIFDELEKEGKIQESR
jgi:predicted ArsR family transcriptional regulator